MVERTEQIKKSTSATGDTVTDRLSGKDTILDRPAKRVESPAEKKKRMEYEELVAFYSAPQVFKLPDGTWGHIRWIPDSRFVTGWKERNFGCNIWRCFRYAVVFQLLGSCAASLGYWLSESIIFAAMIMFIMFLAPAFFIIKLMEKLDRNPIPSFRKIADHKHETIVGAYFMFSFFMLSSICVASLMIMI